MEAALTQLIFEHTLRIRVGSHTSPAKDEKDKDKDKDSKKSGASTPAIVVEAPSSEAGDSTTQDGASTVGEASTSTGTTAAGSSSPTTAEKPKLKVEDQSGKILTVLTNDLMQLQFGIYFVLPRMFPLATVDSSLTRES